MADNIFSEICKELDNATILNDSVIGTDFVDSGSYALNKILSGRYDGGYPIGGITEIYGESSTAKTVFLTHAFKGAQQKGYYTVMIDNEHAYSPAFATKLGVDGEKLIYTMPETIEDCFETVEKVINAIRAKDADTPILIGFDSIGTVACRKEMDDNFGANPEMIGAIRAKATGICLRRINPLLRKKNAGLIIINQVRSKVGVMFGDPTAKAGGGKSLDYYCAVCMNPSVGKNDVLKDDQDNPVGIKGKIRNKKNKVAIPFQECEFKLLFDRGLVRSYGLTTQAIKAGVVQKHASGWYTLKGEEKKFRMDDMDDMLIERIEKGELDQESPLESA
jgi:recombination protein RecA